MLVGASLTGIVVRLGGSQPPIFYRWADITNLHNHKRNFGIELTEDRTAQFVMDDKELAKYVWKVCVQQVGTAAEFAVRTEKQQQWGV